MRTFFGYLTIIIFIPIFIMLVFLTTAESKAVRSFNSVVDEKINLSPIELEQTSFILDSNGDVISEIVNDEDRTYLNLTEIPTFLLDLFIITEDKHFYNHLGFDLTAIGRALTANVQANNVEQGASTITQQLARSQYLSTEKTYNRKLSEVLYAYALERAFSKKELLELYVNAIYFQNGVYGIEAAAQYYFQQEAKELTNAQLAFLAAIPNNPTLYNPLKNFDKTKQRQERMIDQMLTAQKISTTEAEQYINEKITLNVKQREDLFPDYTTYVEHELKQLVAHQDGYQSLLANGNENDREFIENKLNNDVAKLLKSGVIISTSLDRELQTKASNAVKRHLQYDNIEGAAVVIRHDTNEIIALIGGKQYEKHNFNRAYQAYRQPGSVIKPLIAYAPYLERTKAPLTTIVNANNFCIGKYCPKNYGGGQYGDVTLATAFTYSYNTPAVRLLQSVGIKEAFADLKAFNFNKVSAQDYNYPAAIGGFTYGMNPLELTDAFTVFAKDGYFKKSRAITKVTDRSGNILYKWDEKETQVWSVATVNKVRQLMNGTVTSGTGRRAFVPKSYIGGKTGTSNDYKDLWFIGLTDELTAGVWIGQDVGGDVYYVNNIQPQQSIWKDIIK